MCVIYGTLFGWDKDWSIAQHELALKRGKDPITIRRGGGNLWHYRIPTNQSTDKYPVVIDGQEIAMNGIVSQQEYKRLVEKYGKLDYTLDTAYLLKEVQTNGVKALDTLDYVFAFWLVDEAEDKIIFANKDYPLYIKYTDKFYFSSFPEEGFEALGNRAIEVNTATGKITELHKYKNLIYGNKYVK